MEGVSVFSVLPVLFYIVNEVSQSYLLQENSHLLQIIQWTTQTNHPFKAYTKLHDLKQNTETEPKHKTSKTTDFTFL